jgi:hypothetical protein
MNKLNLMTLTAMLTFAWVTIWVKNALVRFWLRFRGCHGTVLRISTRISIRSIIRRILIIFSTIRMITIPILIMRLEDIRDIH